MQQLFLPFLLVYILVAPCVQPVEVVLNRLGQSNGCQSLDADNYRITLAGNIGDWLNTSFNNAVGRRLPIT